MITIRAKPLMPHVVLDDETGHFVMTDRISSVYRDKNEKVTTLTLRESGFVQSPLDPKEILRRMYNE